KIEYLENDDVFATDVLRHIDEGAKMTNPFFQAQNTISHALPTREQLQQAFLDSEFEGAAAQTAIIAQECNVEIK
ncbi:hypothetical protein L0N33_24450, partial [Roseburia faecis]|nr:hypothetical protein [Roseburia faecis]